MICKKCFDELKEALIGQEDGNSRVTSISRVPNGQLVFSDNFIPIYITVDKKISKGKNKGQIKQEESCHYFESKYCPKCGLEFEKKQPS